MRQDLHAEIGNHRSRLLRYAKRQLGNAAHAEDAVQETMVAALEGAGSFAGEAALGTWLTGILRHKIVDCVRRAARERAEPLDAEAMPGNLCDPAQAAHGGSVLRRLDGYLGELPARAAQVFILRDVFGMSAAEACGTLDITTGNCAVLLHRARRRLRERLSDDRVGIGA